MGSHPVSETGATGFDALYGLELTECSDEIARGRVHVREELRQSGGFAHGGVYAAIADALATHGTAASVAGEGRVAVALTNQTTVLHPVVRGAVHATARRRHRGRTTWVWEIDIADDDGVVCVAGRVTVSVRDVSVRDPQ
jgi:1,4-dihydroxy-2-naphthoyl-CoA hydrolase